MKNYFKTNLTVKLFVLVCSVLISISLLICGLFGITMPKSYVELQNKEFENDTLNMIDSMKIMNIEEAKETLNLFSNRTGIYVELYDAQGEYICAYGNKAKTHISGVNQTATYSEQGDFTFSDQAIGNLYENQYKISISNQVYTLLIWGNDTETVNEVTVILQNTIPWIVAVMVVLSFIIALFLSRYITKPIQVINANAKKIANLSFDIHYEASRNDELGELSKTINLLSQKLNHALSSLEDELKREKELEERQRLFFAAASHELKTPLTVMKGNLEGMIYGYSEYGDKDKYIAKTLRTSTQMEHLIGEILALSAMGTEDYRLTKEDFNLRDVVDELLSHFAELIELKAFKVIASLQDVCITADKRLFTKAIQNIISNALHYSHDKETIIITLTKEVLQIENTGVLLNEKHITNLFDPFYRVDKSRSRQTGGSGLGLYFVKTILNKHGLDYDIKNGVNSVIFEVYI